MSRFPNTDMVPNFQKYSQITCIWFHTTTVKGYHKKANHSVFVVSQCSHTCLPYKVVNVYNSIMTKQNIHT